MYLNESSFTEQMRLREHQLTRELELRRMIHERMRQEGLLDEITVPKTHHHIRWGGLRHLGHA